MPTQIPEHTINKVVFGGNTLIDLTAATVTAATMLSGTTAHDASGAIITGSCTYDANTQDATALVAEVLSTKTFYSHGNKLTGTMPNRGGVTGTITTKAQEYTIQQGYHDGSGKVSISSTEQAKIISTNIRQGITILGVEGSMSGSEDVHAQALSCTPSLVQQVITPDSDHNYLTQVTVAAISYVETTNAAGGYTATIA